MSTITYTGKLVLIECYLCHIDFAVPAEFDKDRLRDRRTFYCPSGHGQGYIGQSEEQKLRGLLAAAEGEAAAQRAKARTAENRRRAAKGQLTKTKKRIGNGVCPCCNRHFVNVERHMDTKHPDYASAP